jgi:hypothetical protein
MYTVAGSEGKAATLTEYGARDGNVLAAEPFADAHVTPPSLESSKFKPLVFELQLTT